MTSVQLLSKKRGLVKAFREYQKRYLSRGEKPDVRKLLLSDLYYTMRLEGEKITWKQAQSFFR